MSPSGSVWSRAGRSCATCGAIPGSRWSWSTPRGRPTTSRLRGTVSDLVLDPEFALERSIAEKYVGEWTDVEPAGTPRFATSIVIEKTTMQLGAPA